MSNAEHSFQKEPQTRYKSFNKVSYGQIILRSGMLLLFISFFSFLWRNGVLSCSCLSCGYVLMDFVTFLSSDLRASELWGWIERKKYSIKISPILWKYSRTFFLYSVFYNIPHHQAPREHLHSNTNHANIYTNVLSLSHIHANPQTVDVHTHTHTHTHTHFVFPCTFLS